MLIIGIDYHPSFQQIAFMDQETGEYDIRHVRGFKNVSVSQRAVRLLSRHPV
jgi:hypothetical protein